MTTPPVTIRRAHHDDLYFMSTLLEDLFSLEADFSFDRERQIKGLKALVAREGVRLLVAEAVGKVVGMCSGQVVISTAEGGPAVLVEDVVVDNHWRGLGIGRLLLSGVVQWARKQGAGRLQLLADRDNKPALAFYEHLGWSKTRLMCLRLRGSDEERSWPR